MLLRDDYLKAKKRRKPWVDFVKAQVSQPSRSSLICSMHFKTDDFVRRLDFEEEEGILLTPWPNKDEFGKNHFSTDSCSHCWI